MTRRTRLLLVAVCAVIVVAIGWAVMQPSAPTTPTAATPTRATPTTSGLPTCQLAGLPREATDTVRAIHAGGPFPFPRNDGVVFGNREGHLPDQARSYYREYTVITPGAPNRSTRRIIAGGSPVTDPPEYYYTADHYDSFCRITGAGGRP